jgi:hypothetical protein
MQGISCSLVELLASQEAQKYRLLEWCLIKRFYAVILSLMFHVNCLNSVRIFVINLVIFYTFFLLLPWPSNCAVYVYLCIVTFEC